MKKHSIRPLAALAILACTLSPAWADYTLVLKNGRRITVPSYRETPTAIEIPVFGGELAIPRDQIRTISKADESDRADLDVTEIERQREGAPVAPPSRIAPSEVPLEPAPESSSPEGAGTDPEQERKLAEIEEKLVIARQRYFRATQGGGSGAAATAEGYRALTADLMSRLKSRRGAADSEYEPQERQIRDLRLEIERLQKERDELLSQMKAAGTGADSR